jgi:hypothetical protein
MIYFKAKERVGDHDYEISCTMEDDGKVARFVGIRDSRVRHPNRARRRNVAATNL